MKRIMIDPSKCDGCKNCALACMDSHRKDGKTGVETLNFADPANEARNDIVNDGSGGYLPMFCRHCSVPQCAGSCMSGALYQDEKTGHVLYDETRCGACFMCVMNCPYGIPKPDVSRVKILKCDFCMDREEGPACVAACPKNAIYVEEV
ncbi:MAG: 4Fe-4S dicluster domain-containing protein [Lachnospiraceae bacterium]|nr:4Fe-4S dicluster domain-containing protein [Lachnospiraceae bacterium]